MNLETKITIYKFTPQVFTLTPVQFENLGQSEKLFRLQKKVDKSCFHALHVLNPFVYQCFGVKGDR